MTSVLIEAAHVTKVYRLAGPSGRRLVAAGARIAALDDVSLLVGEGEIVGIVGESGAGKSTLARALLRLTDVDSGTISFEGRDITRLREREMRAIRPRIQMVFQDPFAALNPAMRIGEALAHPLEIHGLAPSGGTLTGLLEEVGLDPPGRYLDAYPHELSGGELQRIVVAKALAMRPRLLVADEPVAMLDPSVRARVLDVMLRAKLERGLTYVVITHDLAMASMICDRIAIMYVGEIVEEGPATRVIDDPQHPYTRCLLSALSRPDPLHRRPPLPRGELPDASRPPAGCRFHPRCPWAFEDCGWVPEDVREWFDWRWTTLDRETAEREASVLGPASRWTVAGRELRIAGGSDTEALLRSLAVEALVLRTARMARDGDEVVLSYPRPVRPSLGPSEASRVACLLYPGSRPDAGGEGSA